MILSICMPSCCHSSCRRVARQEPFNLFAQINQIDGRDALILWKSCSSTCIIFKLIFRCSVNSRWMFAISLFVYIFRYHWLCSVCECRCKRYHNATKENQIQDNTRSQMTEDIFQTAKSNQTIKFKLCIYHCWIAWMGASNKRMNRTHR